MPAGQEDPPANGACNQTLVAITTEIDTIATGTDATEKTVAIAKELAEQYADAVPALGDSRDIAIAVLLIGSHVVGPPLDEQALKSSTNTSSEDIDSLYQSVVESLDAPVLHKKAADLVPEMAAEIGLSDDNIAQAKELIMRDLHAQNLAEREARCIAAGALDAAAELDGPREHTRTTIAESTGVSTATIRRIQFLILESAVHAPL